jgi:excisionase family DNA binding protein
LRILRLLQILRLKEVGQLSGNSIIGIRPGEVDADLAKRAMRRISEYLASNPEAEPIEVLGEVGNDEALVVPRAVAALLAQVLGFLANGQGVQLMPDDAMLTTQQAADLMNVSRPYLIGLLETGTIPYQMVGTHRRIAFQDLMEYIRQDDQRRREVLDELAELGEELNEA